MDPSVKKRLICFLLSSFISAEGHAAIALVNHTHSAACATTVPATTSGNLLVVFCESQSGTFAASVSDNATGGSNTYTEIVGSRGSLTTSASSNIFYSQSIHGGATTVTCAGSCYASAMYEYSGALASGNPVDTSTGSLTLGCGVSTCTCNPITTTNAGDALFGDAIPGHNITAVASPYGNFLNDANGAGTADYVPGTTVSNHAAVWTNDTAGDSFACSAAAFLPAVTASVSGTPKMKKYERNE